MKRGNWVEVKKELHDLKGTGTTMGYPMVTELASQIYVQIINNQLEVAKQLLPELELVAQRIQAGCGIRTPEVIES